MCLASEIHYMRCVSVFWACEFFDFTGIRGGGQIFAVIYIINYAKIHSMIEIHYMRYDSVTFGLERCVSVILDLGRWVSVILGLGV